MTDNRKRTKPASLAKLSSTTFSTSRSIVDNAYPRLLPKISILTVFSCLFFKKKSEGQLSIIFSCHIVLIAGKKMK